mmetsp:Transcript_12462/g.29220  ORF Transcript_12462/g.29220 Transcript_12462/m.29220 type:complete len:261 (+) Transcript_12462:257-1039(+)
MSMLQINTAVPLMEPLLEQQKDQDEGPDQERTNREGGSRTKFAVLGAITGFFIQIISLGAYAFLLVHYRGSSLQASEGTLLTESGFFRTPTMITSDTIHNDDLFGNKTMLYSFISVLTQIDLIAYVLIWVAFTCTMTRNGMACIRTQFFGEGANGKDEGVEAKQNRGGTRFTRRRDVFVLGVYFLVGIVLGAFGAWSAIDLYLGFPIPFMPIITTVAFDLLLCYLMVWCYDLGGEKKRANNYECDEGEDDDYECEEVSCC